MFRLEAKPNNLIHMLDHIEMVHVTGRIYFFQGLCLGNFA